MEACSTRTGIYRQNRPQIDEDQLLTYARKVLTDQQFCAFRNVILFGEKQIQDYYD